MNRFLTLVKVELTRLRARRAILLILAAAILVPLVIAFFVAIDTRPASDADVAAAERQIADDPFYERQVRRCIEKPQRYGIAPDVRDDADALEAACVDSNIPTVEDYLYSPVLDLDDEREYNSGLAVVTILGVLMFLAGTTFAGHDWSTGSMSNQLLFEPRRLRIWAAKALAVLVTAGVLSAVVLTAYWLGLYTLTQSRDLAVREGALLDCLQQGWRGAGVAAAAALGGYALTMLSRSTVFSLGLLFGVSVAGGLLLATVGPEDPGWLDPTINAQAVISDGATYYVDVPDSCYSGRGGFDQDDPRCVNQRERSLTQGLTYYGILLGAAAVASAGSFRRRDVP
ncbi:hypothetical protein BH09ACT12_BH09ACT12_36850 [soil metagenome]